MKWLIVTLLLAVQIAYAESGTGQDLAEPPGFTYVLPPGFEWPTGLFKTVLVTGRGDTPYLARADAFRQAVEQTAGVSVVTQTQITNFRLAHDSVRTTTQAHISNFAIVTVNKVQGVWQCQLWATVRGS